MNIFGKFLGIVKIIFKIFFKILIPPPLFQLLVGLKNFIKKLNFQ